MKATKHLTMQCVTNGIGWSTQCSEIARRRFSLKPQRCGLFFASLIMTAPLQFPFAQPAYAQSPAALQAKDFTQSRFKQAMRNGDLVIVETYADWCAPCQIQAPIIERLRREKRYRSLIVLRVDEETPRNVWGELGLAGFGQLVVFRDGKEIGRGSPLNEVEMRGLLSGK